jgi:hypothetical protein
MTWMMLLIVPTVIVTGTLLGSLLRKLSRDAQAQVIMHRPSYLVSFLSLLTYCRSLEGKPKSKGNARDVVPSFRCASVLSGIEVEAVQ